MIRTMDSGRFSISACCVIGIQETNGTLQEVLLHRGRTIQIGTCGAISIAFPAMRIFVSLGYIASDANGGTDPLEMLNSKMWSLTGLLFRAFKAPKSS